MDLDLSKYTQQRKRGANSERAEIADLTAKLLNQDIKKVLGLTRHLQPDQMYRLYRLAENKPQFWWYIYNLKYKQNNMEKIVKERLENVPNFRERKNRGKYIAILALRTLKEEKHETLEKKFNSGALLTIQEMSAFGMRYDTLRNAWDTVLRDNPHLRGSDYDEGKKLEESVQRQKGYNV